MSAMNHAPSKRGIGAVAAKLHNPLGADREGLSMRHCWTCRTLEAPLSLERNACSMGPSLTMKPAKCPSSPAPVPPPPPNVAGLDLLPDTPAPGQRNDGGTGIGGGRHLFPLPCTGRQ